MTPLETAQAKKLTKIIMMHMEIDLMNHWIADMNGLRQMIIWGGIKPLWDEMKYIPYPKNYDPS